MCQDLMVDVEDADHLSIGATQVEFVQVERRSGAEWADGRTVGPSSHEEAVVGGVHRGSADCDGAIACRIVDDDLLHWDAGCCDLRCATQGNVYHSDCHKNLLAS